MESKVSKEKNPYLFCFSRYRKCQNKLKRTFRTETLTIIILSAMSVQSDLDHKNPQLIHLPLLILEITFLLETITIILKLLITITTWKLSKKDKLCQCISILTMEVVSLLISKHSRILVED